MTTVNGEGAGKGDKPRPVDKKVYDKNFEAIDWHRPAQPKQTECPKQQQDK